ncbi:hypothetical protein H0H92_004913 [Tricholoma furcatifolium]|nr:hypothetical protein H0H92_004913 [Tricholoma furcatifolium]
MNYLRGAVNAISAPYHYYKDLPPINPSTLTGAIDVIVIQRPTDNGDTELVCSPFHVRFGKWQVLRPSEKKVNVSVNGHPIPFNMKIGEAGEAFFVFETEEDIPDDLITSPILQPTRPDDGGTKVAVDNLDTKHAELVPDLHANDQGPHVKAEETLHGEPAEDQEPDFLDLDAQPSKPVDGASLKSLTPRQSFAHLANGQLAGLPSPPLTPAHHTAGLTPEMAEQELRVDEALRAVRESIDLPEEQLQDRSMSPSPVRGLELSNDEEPPLSTSLPSSVTFPVMRAASEPPPDILDHPPALPYQSHNQASSSKIKLPTLSPVQEYSWEWGAFPQPSPLQPTFPKSSRIEGSLGRKWNKGKFKAPMDTSMPEFSGLTGNEGNEGEGNLEQDYDHEHTRSRSVPPELEGSPTRQRRIKELVDEYDTSHEHEEDDMDDSTFGQGGILRSSKKDPTRFALLIEGRKVVFELSVISSTAENTHSDGALFEPEEGVESDGMKEWRSSLGKAGSLKHFGGDEVEAAALFAMGKVDYDTFLNDDKIVHDPRLVIRWAGSQYITRNDGSPLMHALVSWRNATLQEIAQRFSSRPTSPVSEEENDDIRPLSPPPSSDEQPPEEERYHYRSKSEPPEKVQGKPPTSTSWVRWWSRSGKKTDTKEENVLEQAPAMKTERPIPQKAISVPFEKDANGFDLKKSKDIPPAESAPAYPSTPVQIPVKTPTPAFATSPQTARRYAKTLRLTSDQLKSLNLKPGANSITFSLSASGAIACTARIFVWDSTDFVVVSDIDGTITKSDGLGHVFAMIGRDWTHLGVAKLYTDITRNGYKIMYLTSRAIGQADATRDYLKGIKQNNYQLPEGPVIMSPDRLMTSLHREVILRKPEVFKMACLRDIQRLFGEASRNPFYAGFGNRITDALSYRSVNVPSARIFTIDSSGEVKMELLELAGYKSSYIHMTDLVDQMFPPIHRKWTPEFTDFNYWKVPVQEFPLPDLSPPSPALSARSDTSTFARLRNFSLVSGRQNSTPVSRMSPPPDEDRGRSSHLRQMSSLERISNTFGFSTSSSGSQTSDERRSTSPGSSYYDSDDEGDGEDGKGGRRRERRRSMASMPGTLDEMHFGMDDDDDEPHYGRDDDEGVDGSVEHLDEQEAGDEDFDEDLMAAGEMKNPTRVSEHGLPRRPSSIQHGLPPTFIPAAAPGEEYVPAPPSALHATDGDAFNVDPTVPYLDSGGSAAYQPVSQQSPTSRGSKRFSELSQFARRAMSRRSTDGPQRDPEEGFPLHSARSPSPPAHVPNESSSSHTYEGSTAVSHEMLPVAQTIGSPVYIEPRPTLDYAKMDDPPRGSIGTFSAYVSRVREFFREINDLPWVADRITVDYVPGATKGRRHVRPTNERRPQRPTTWYDDTPRPRPQLFSDTTSPDSQPANEPQLEPHPPTPFVAPTAPSLPPQDAPSLQQEPRAPTPPQEVTFVIMDKDVPSNAPYATVVPAGWSLNQPERVTTPPRGPGIASNYPQNVNPVYVAPVSSQSHSFPEQETVVPHEYQQFVTSGENFPTGFVRHEDVETSTAGYGDRRYHPRSGTTTPAATTGHGDAVGVPGATPGPNLLSPLSTFPVEPMAQYDPNQPSIISPAGEDSPLSSAPSTPYALYGKILPKDFSYVDYLRQQKEAASVATSQQPLSQYAAPSPARSSAQPRAASLSRPPSAASSRDRVSVSSSRTQQPAMSQRRTLSRPPSAAPSHASRRPSVNATPRAHTPASMQYAYPVPAPAA